MTEALFRDPWSATGRRLQPPAIARLMTAALENPRLLSLAAGFTDGATLPLADVGEAVGELAARGAPPEHLQYGTNQGRAGLRELLAARTARADGLPESAVAPERTMIGNGSQQLLYLAMQVLCDPGDIVLVERPTYFVFLEMLAGLGVRAVSLPASPDGTFDLPGVRSRLAGLRRGGEAARVKAAYLMSYFANPSGFSRSGAEKDGLAAALREAGMIVPVIEDAAYRDLWFERPWPARSTLASAAWEDFPRLYLGTLTKSYATGLKIGYAHATEAAWLERMLWLKGHHDFGSANFNQAVLETALRRGGLETHLAGVRPVYAAKKRRLGEALERAGLRTLGWQWGEPAGGLYLWLRAPEEIDTDADGAFWRACLEQGVLYVPGMLCLSDADDHRYARLSFGVLEPAQLAEAAQRFARAAAVAVG